MDIRKYFTSPGQKLQSSGHNTRKQTSQPDPAEKKRASKTDLKSSSTGGKTEKRRRAAIISDSSDDDVELIEDNLTPRKKQKTDLASVGRSSPRLKNITLEKSRKEQNVTAASASSYFGTKTISKGSTDAPNTKATKIDTTLHKSPAKSKSPGKSKSPSKGKSAAGGSSRSDCKMTAKVSKDEIMLIDNEDWSDEESFAQLIEDQTSGREPLKEEHQDEKFNKALKQVDENKSGSSKVKPKKESSVKHEVSRSSVKHEVSRAKNAKKIKESHEKQEVKNQTPKKASDGKASNSQAQKKRKVSLAGLTFVVTGQLEKLERDEAKELIIKYGGRCVSAVSGKVNYLVAGSEAGESKLAKAEKNANTKVITETEFYELLGVTSPDELNVEGDNSEEGARRLQAEQEVTPPAKVERKVSPVKVQTTKASAVASSNRPSVTQSETKSVMSKSAPGTEADSLMWVDKYKPTALNKIIGQTGDKSNAKKLLNWLNSWHKHKELGTKPAPKFGGFGGYGGDQTGAGLRAALLSGPPGIGKTTTATLVCKEAGFSYFEMNASDSRNKKTLKEVVGQALGNTTLMDFTDSARHQQTQNKKHCIIMDEVDGMAGNEDRGGMQELIQLIKTSSIPVICICNDRQSMKVKSLANHCFDLRFSKPRVDQIKAAMMSVCCKEGINIDGAAMNEVIEASNHDIRQVLHNLSVWSAADKDLGSSQLKSQSSKAKKDLKIDPFTACQLTFNHSENAKMSLKDKSDLFFYDYSIHPLFVQENYPYAKPYASSSDSDTLKRLAKASNYIAMGDCISRAIRTDKWSLLPMQAMFSSVLPADALMGNLTRRIEFPRWLGKFSTTNKNVKLNKEISVHMGLTVSGSSRDVILDYLPILRDKLTQPLIKKDPSEAVGEVLGIMQQYDLLKDDYDNIIDLTQWPGKPEIGKMIETKTKAAFTRQYNKAGHKTHYAIDQGPIKKKRGATAAAAVRDEMDALGMDVDELDDSGEDDEEVASSFKVQPKKTAAKKAAPAAKNTGKKSSSTPKAGGRKK